MFDMEGLSSSRGVVTAMITPAVLISASGTMILSSSTRLGRVVDRTRSLSDRLQEVSSGDANTEFFEERRAMILDQHDKLTSRSNYLQSDPTTIYFGQRWFLDTHIEPRGVCVSIAHTLCGYVVWC